MKRYKKNIKKYKVIIFTLCTVIIFFAFFKGMQLVKRYFFSPWATFVSNGQIVSQLFNYKNLLIFGTNYAKLYFLNLGDENKVSVFDMNSGNARPVQIVGNNVLAVSDDTISLINIKKNKAVWQISTDNQYFFVNTQVYKRNVIAGSTDGSLTMFELASGKVLWKFKPEPIELLSSIDVAGNLHYFGNFIINENNIFLASQDKILYILNVKTGLVIKKIPIGETITMGPEVSGKFVYVGTKSGDLFAVNQDSGEILWKSNDQSFSICGKILPFIDSDYPHMQLFTHVKQAFRKVFNEKLTIYTFQANGSLIARDAGSGKLIWKSKEYGPTLVCPTFWRSTVVIGTNSGNLASLSLGSGKIIFEKDNMGSLKNQIVISPKFDSILPEWLNIFSPNIFVHNTTGTLWMIHEYGGKVVWKFEINAPTNTTLNVFDNEIFLVASDGVIYRLDKHSGKIRLNIPERRFDITKEIQNVSDTQIQEFTLKSYANFSNPWRETDLGAVFIHESGAKVFIPGFYYDQDKWKIRFNPPLKGKWKWEIYWKPHGKLLIKKGDFVSETDTSHFYIRKAGKESTNITVDGKSIFNGLGIGDVMLDSNWNGNFLDDWAIGNSTPFIATDSSGFINRFESNKVTRLAEYISTYGPKGAGFNIVRWNLLNASDPIVTSLDFPTKYSTLRGKIGDEFVKSLRSNNIHIWLTLFGFDIPYKYSSNIADQYILKSYLRYMYARYGAYTDIWELANEVSIPTEMATLLSDEIRAMDHECRMVSVSSTGYNFPQADVIAPHWYETEKVNESDIRTFQKIKEFKSYERPIVFAEQGNTSANYDETSSVRMRIRSWTAFFNNAVLMFWNQSSTKDYKAGIFPANLYLGEQERSYTKILQNFSQGFPLDSKNVQYQIDWSGVRGYGLNSDTVNAAYFVHFASPFTLTQFNLNIFTKNGGKLQWLDPETGVVIQEGRCPPGFCNLISPVFKTDIAFKIN
jgi:outer membrane protein assembly factor BamB